MSALRLTEAEFEALRNRGKAVRSIKSTVFKVAPARTAVKRKTPAGNMATLIQVPAVQPETTFKPEPRRIMVADISMAKTGLAWGKAGELPLATLCLMAGKKDDTETEAYRVSAMAESIAWHAASKGCCLILIPEFYNTRNLLAFRANCSLRGAVMLAANRWGLTVFPINEITCRKAAGVDLSRPKGQPLPKGYMKDRARTRLEQLGLGHLQEDEGDAALMLIGCKDIVEFGE